MARSSFSYEKRSRELAKQRKKALKAKKRFERRNDEDQSQEIPDHPGASDAGGGEQQAEAGEPHPSNDG